MRAAVLACALASSCSLALNFNECNKNEDCASRAADGGSPFYCTNDHLCVGSLPDDKLCTDGLFGAKPGGDTVMVAGLFRLSGAADSKDTEISNAARLAFTEVNTVGQRHIGMVLCDIAGDGVPVRALQKAITTYHVVGAVGPTTSGDTKSVIDLAKANDVLLISPSATSPTLTNVDDNGLLWRTCASDNLQSKVLAQIIPLQVGMPLAGTRVDIAYADSAYGIGLDGAFIDSWTTRSGAPPVSTVKYAEGSDPSVTIGKLAADAPDYSVIVADTDANKLVQALGAAPAALSQTQFLLTDGAKGADLLLNPNMGVLQRVRGTGPATPSGVVYDSFSSTYKNQFGTDPAGTSFVANAYDASYALALCIAGLPAGTPVTGQAMVGVMKRLSAPGQQLVSVGPNGFTTGASALSSGGAVRLKGTSSDLVWDNVTGDLVTAPIEVWTIDFSTGKPQFKTTMVVTP